MRGPMRNDNDGTGDWGNMNPVSQYQVLAHGKVLRHDVFEKMPVLVKPINRPRAPLNVSQREMRFAPHHYRHRPLRRRGQERHIQVGMAIFVAEVHEGCEVCPVWNLFGHACHQEERLGHPGIILRVFEARLRGNCADIVIRPQTVSTTKWPNRRHSGATKEDPASSTHGMDLGNLRRVLI